ncbi:hypothetical protein FRC11_001914 [Ceratobasidium sp. 423]|nr:hypothetical protein FRC11_001914 [Ceratobasidium sp. 423]
MDNIGALLEAALTAQLTADPSFLKRILAKVATQLQADVSEGCPGFEEGQVSRSFSQGQVITIDKRRKILVHATRRLRTVAPKLSQLLPVKSPIPALTIKAGIATPTESILPTSLALTTRSPSWRRPSLSLPIIRNPAKTLPPLTTSPSKSPAPVKPKAATKLKSKLQHAPTVGRDSDDEVITVEEPGRKRKAKDTPGEPPAKQQRSTGTHALAPVETDEEQELERPKKARARPRARPPPAPEPEVETQPESAEDEDRLNERSPRDPTSEPEPEVKQPAKAKSTSSKARRKHSSRAPTPHPRTETDQTAEETEETEPDPEPFKQKRARRPKTPSSEPKIDEDDGDEYQPSSESDRPKKRACQDRLQDDPPDDPEDTDEACLEDVVGRELCGDPESLGETTGDRGNAQPSETVANGAGDVKEERNLTPEPVYYPNPLLRMAKTPTVKKLPTQGVIDHYGASNTISNTTNFLMRRCRVARQDVSISPWNHVKVWHKLYLYHDSPSFAPFDPIRRGVVRASAPKPREPGVWDVTLYPEKPNRARSENNVPEKHGLHRYRAGRVRALFTLPAHLQFFYPGQLAYLELFTAFDTHASPSKLHSTKPDFDLRGVRWTLVVPVSDIVFACNLVLKFYMLNPELELHAYTDLLADGRNFWLNHYYNHHFYRLMQHWRRRRPGLQERLQNLQRSQLPGPSSLRLHMDKDLDESDETFFRLGIIYEQQQNYEGVLKCFERIHRNTPAPLTNINNWFQDYTATKDAYEHVLQDDLNRAPAPQQLGWYILGRAYMAYESYQQVVYHGGRSPTFWCGIDVLYYNNNALDAYLRAIRINPSISEISDVTDVYVRVAEPDPSNPHITQRLNLLRDVQANGGTLHASPGPQDIHPTVYAGSGPMNPMHTAVRPPHLTGGSAICSVPPRGSTRELPALLTQTRGGTPPFHAPPPVRLDEGSGRGSSTRLPQMTPSLDLDRDRAPPSSLSIGLVPPAPPGPRDPPALDLMDTWPLPTNELFGAEFFSFSHT